MNLNRLRSPKNIPGCHGLNASSGRVLYPVCGCNFGSFLEAGFLNNGLNLAPFQGGNIYSGHDSESWQRSRCEYITTTRCKTTASWVVLSCITLCGFAVKSILVPKVGAELQEKEEEDKFCFAT